MTEFPEEQQVCVLPISNTPPPPVMKFKRKNKRRSKRKK